MKIKINRWALACVCIAMVSASAAFAQSSGSDQSTGVSHPPPDDIIVATPDTEPPPPPPAAVQAKPSAATPSTVPAATRPAQSYNAVVTTGPADSSATRSKLDNTDYGIVTVPGPPAQTTPQPFGDTAVLHTRDNTPDGIVTQVPGSANELPEGTMIRVQLNSDFSTRYTAVGTPFEGRVVNNVVENGSVVIPAGSTLRGRVSQASQGHHVGFGPAATLRLRPEVVILPDGTAYHLDAEAIKSDASGTRVGREGGIKPTNHVLKKTIEYGAVAGGGAVVGAELAGPVGAVAGTLVGAGVVTTHLLERQPLPVIIPTGSQIVFSLTQPLNLVPTRN